MSLTRSTTDVETANTIQPARTSRLRVLLTTWELYPIVLLAAFLRFYQINVTEFDDDQVVLYRMAYNAVHNGLLPVMSNGASIGIAQPPGVIYLNMLPALFSANPLGGVLFVAFLTLLGVILTYFFTSRYFGRFAGTVAALLYGTAAAPVHYARFIWQPNMMPPFTMLFFFALFWGVIERRKGWLFPALALLGILYQMHEITLLLAVPLAIAMAFAYNTVRWRDIIFALIALVIIFFPYLLWEFFSNFTDVHTVLIFAKQHSSINSQSIQFYRLFLVPFTQQPTYPGSLLLLLAPLLSWLVYLMPALIIASIVASLVCIVMGVKRGTKMGQDGVGQEEPGLGQAEAPTMVVSSQRSFKSRWFAFGANPYRGGLLLLVVWQVFPVVVLLRHAIDLHTQYFFVLMPGPFILLGIFAAQMVEWSHVFSSLRLARYGIYVLLALIVGAQLMGTTAQIIDMGNGNFDGRNPQIGTYYNDLNSLQQAINEADQQAQQRHVSHVYIAADFVTTNAESYLIGHMPLHTATTLFDASNCVVLPNPANGPAMMLVSPYDTFASSLLSRFASVSLIARPDRLGGPPFLLYMVTPLSGQGTAQAFTNNLQFVDAQTYQSNGSSAVVLATRWSLLRSAPAIASETYNYAFTMNMGSGHSLQSGCSLTALGMGDQLVAAFHLPKNSILAPQVTMGAQYSTTHPYDPTYGPFHLEIDATQSSPSTLLVTADGSTHLTVSS
ncbi:MAG TPA: glycosyltransferase family 39 protein [Ktedonobacteraceae bacterium]|nr:glycosyltransferase family 39 protein [Ktedonobacteraceae bacterium]